MCTGEAIMERAVDSADKLIFALYSAAKDPSQLPSFVSSIGQQFRAHIAGIRIYDAGYASYRYASSVGFSPNEWAAWDANCAWCNVWRPRGFTDMLREGVGHSETILSRPEFVKTPFYNEYAKSSEIDHGMGLCLWASPPEQMVSISLNRSHRIGAFDKKELAFAKRLLPHFRSAYAIMRRLSWLDSERSSYESAIERLSVGFIVCDAAGSCLYRNEAADVAVSAGAGLVLAAPSRVHCTDRDAQRMLRDTLHSAAQDRLTSPARIYVRDATGVLRFILIVTMLRGEISARPVHGGPCAAIFIHSRAEQTRAAQAPLQDAFGLTAAEARLATRLADGDELAVCAQALGVSLSTVRTQLRNLFAKTGTSRQAALIAALSFALRAT
jgi:DNA-binding CsgD family transcriptional regulator